MNKKCRLQDLEYVLEEMDFSEIADDVVELDEGYQLVLSGWYVLLPELHLRLHEGVVGYWNEEMKDYMPDFCVTVLYPEEFEETEWLYYEQDGMFTTMVNWLHSQMPIEVIGQLICEIVTPCESTI